jgi:cytochrome oxidase assembly protein ShyY1
MLERGWLMRRNKGVRATIAGRRHGRTHLRGLVRMPDQGTRRQGVARMMTVLNLATIECDGDYDDSGEDH